MNILFIHQYFKTPKQGGGIRSYLLAKELVKEGHHVSVVTTSNSGRKKHVSIDGISVFYLPIPYFQSFGYQKRIITFVKFAFQSFWKAKNYDFDVAYVITTPLTTGLTALMIKLFLKKKYIFEVGDLWPEVPVQMGVIDNHIIKSLLYQFEKLVYRQAHQIIALSPDIHDYIARKTTNPVLTLPNLAQTDVFHPSSCSERDTFIISYIGAAGRANHLEFLIDVAAACLQQHPNIQFQIASTGSELTRIQSMAKDLENVKFLAYGDKEKVSEYLKVANAIYISFAEVDALSTGSPNKLFDGLSAGKLIITNFNGWIDKLLQENRCGFSYNPNDPQEFIRKIKPFCNDDVLLKEYQQNARRLAEQRFSVEVSGQKLSTFLKADYSPTP